MRYGANVLSVFYKHPAPLWYIAPATLVAASFVTQLTPALAGIQVICFVGVRELHFKGFCAS